jgi:hypothetical protein
VPYESGGSLRLQNREPLWKSTLRASASCWSDSVTSPSSAPTTGPAARSGCTSRPGLRRLRGAVWVKDRRQVVLVAPEAAPGWTLGHRGHKHDPLYRCRRLLTRADERLHTNGRTKLLGLLDAGDAHGEARMARHVKVVVRSLYDHTDPDLALAMVERLGRSAGRHVPARGSPARSHPDPVAGPARRLARRPRQQRAHRSREQPHQAREAGVAFGFKRFRNHRVRALL